jgi:hypothetical protein
MNAITQPLLPNKADISAHLYALFDPAFVQAHPDAWIEIAYGRPEGKLNAAANFSAFDVEKAVAFAVKKNKAGYNVYVGAALRQGEKPKMGRADGDHVLDASHAWAEFDGEGDAERIDAILKGHNLTPAMVVTTGTVPHLRAHLYFKLNGAVTPAKLEAANTSLMKLFDSDVVWNADRVMRLAGTVSYPSPKKKAKGNVPELTTLLINKDGARVQGRRTDRACAGIWRNGSLRRLWRGKRPRSNRRGAAKVAQGQPGQGLAQQHAFCGLHHDRPRHVRQRDQDCLRRVLRWRDPGRRLEEADRHRAKDV